MARKRFGQHFLQDDYIIHQIIDFFHPQINETIIEIGPGLGALTFPLLKQSPALTVVELDYDLIPNLQARGKKLGELTIIQADALKFDFSTLSKDEKKIRVIGNLPYNISTPLIFHLLSYSMLISDMLFMLQKEVVDRIIAKPGDSEYGRLSIMVQYQCEAYSLFDVGPEAFSPPPKVNSSVVRLVPFTKLPFKANNYDLFAAIVKQAFNQRRKTLRNSLKNTISDDLWEQAAINPTLRPENLSVADFVNLSNLSF